MKFISSVCGGKFVPMNDASLLSRVIIGGCREEINLGKIADRVIKLYEEQSNVEDKNAVYEMVPS